MTTAVPTDYIPGDTRSPSGAVNKLGIIANSVLDTGWIDIKSLLNTGWTATQLLMRATGPWCYLKAVNLQSTSGTGFDFILKGTIPGNWRPKADCDVSRILSVNGVPTPRRLAIGAAGAFTGERVPYPATQEWVIQWQRTGPFPTTMPGPLVAD